MIGVSARMAGVASLDVLAVLHAACFVEHWDRTAFARLLAMPGAFAFVAVDDRRRDGDLLGFALGRLAADESEVITLGVRPEHRRRGVATTLLTACLEHARAGGATRIFLEVGEDNPAALGLYRGAGLIEVGRRPAYYRRPDGRPAAALIMGRPIPVGGDEGASIARRR